MVTDFRQSRDPITNVIHGQIKRSIKVCIDNDCFDAAIKLIYSGMDTMAYLGIPEKQSEVTRPDFVNWANRYISFPCKEQLSGKIYMAHVAVCSIPILQIQT